MDGLIIRRMSVSDLPQVMVIENRCFTTPWQYRSFEYEIGNSDTILRSAMLKDKVVGYICIRTILDLTHVMNMAVMPEMRHRGIGGRLLENALYQLQQSDTDVGGVTLEVRESNASAIEIYKKAGFEITGRRKKYFQKPEEDALIMLLSL